MMSDWCTNYSYWFERPMLERVGYYEKEKDGKLILLVNALGVSKEDIDVSVQPTEYATRQLIKITGKTHDETFDKDFSVKMAFYVKPVKKIDWTESNGFITLEIEYNEPVVPDVKITRK
jgi:HSP20 family molecular chaperone IbpA